MLVFNIRESRKLFLKTFDEVEIQPGVKPIAWTFICQVTFIVPHIETVLTCYCDKVMYAAYLLLLTVERW